jgi:inner membrane protein
MDTFTHGLAGSALARIAVSADSPSERAGASAALWIGAVAAMLPDLDILLFPSRLDYLQDHRSWTHSFLVLPVLALAVAVAAKPFLGGARLRILWLFASIGIASHILLDWITSFGTMFWTPISRTRYALDWIFVLDPVFTGVAVSTLVLSLVFRSRGRRIALAGCTVLAAYVGACGLLHARALATWRRLDEPPAGARVAVLPQFLSPFRWMAVSETDDRVDVAFFDIGPFASGAADPRPPTGWGDLLRRLADEYPPPERARIRRFRRAAESPALEAARALPDVSVFLAFARFPLETVHPEAGGGATVVVQDLRFLPWFAGPWERDGERGLRRQAFVYRVRLDSGLHAVERGFIRGGRS